MYYVKQIYTECLSEASYYVESDGEAAVVDPIREVDEYVRIASERGAKIKYIFETHFHADFVSGHLDLMRKTGASVVFGPQARPSYEAVVASNSDFFTLGRVKIKVLHTPGHTLESSCYLLVDDMGKDRAIFTGDTLLVGDVGRPDLAVNQEVSKEDLAGMLYESLRNKILTLDGDVVLYPGHGVVSQHGKGLREETISTIGEQRSINYALQPMEKKDFVKAVVQGLTKVPKYFKANAEINKHGYKPLEEELEREYVALSVEEVEESVSAGALVLDSRQPEVFGKGHVEGSLNIGLNGQYAIWAGTLIPLNQSIVLVTDEGKENESLVRLARVGFANVKGYLSGGYESWKNAGKEIDWVEFVEPEEVALHMNKSYSLLDVRRKSETDVGYVQGSEFITLAELEEHTDEVPEGKFLIMCAVGYRSMIAASLLKARGIHRFKIVLGGYSNVKKEKNLILEESKFELL